MGLRTELIAPICLCFTLNERAVGCGHLLSSDQGIVQVSAWIICFILLKKKVVGEGERVSKFSPKV